MDNRQAYEVLMQWSSFAVDTLKRLPGREDDYFSVVMTLVPNPLNYDGMNDVKIEIWCDRRRGDVGYKRNVVMISNHHINIHDCISELNSRLNELQSKVSTQIKELGQFLLEKGETLKKS